LPSPPPTLWRVAELDPTSKRSAFKEAQTRASQCGKCPHLVSSRTNVVFGAGSLESEILFVGEAPGAEEDAIGEPFVGKAGDLLTRIIQAMGLSRETVFIANVLKCRPDTPGKSSGNRKPSATEMATCLPYLEEQIAIIRPKVMVALGATAIEGLMRRTSVQVTRIRGQWFDFHGIPLMPTYHPAYLLRNDSITEKRKVWEDMLAVMEKLQLPISQRQQNFFLEPS
jgi:uracil-DNA glycosylase family 4